VQNKSMNSDDITFICVDHEQINTLRRNLKGYQIQSTILLVKSKIKII
jgi:hypothetical protein